jgi:hypothetical protein
MGIKLFDEQNAKIFGDDLFEAVMKVAEKHNVIAQIKDAGFSPDQFVATLDFTAIGDQDLSNHEAVKGDSIIPFPSAEERKRILGV